MPLLISLRLPFQYLVFLFYVFHFPVYCHLLLSSHCYQLAQQGSLLTTPCTHTLSKNNSVDCPTSLSEDLVLWVLSSITVILCIHLLLLFPTSWRHFRHLSSPGTCPLHLWSVITISKQCKTVCLWFRVLDKNFPCPGTVTFSWSFLQEVLRTHHRWLFHDSL